ncbi:flagellin [Pyrococcus kukulkanii]|uniref:flagellin n=1 Tax=Pyrococcus kukulkanii TaxID=1609559 RepID=UPI00356A3D35
MRRGAIGIGTLIVFIAMVLVAAVAAGVLISTAGNLQQRALSVGRETTIDVSSGIRLISIWGYAPENSTSKKIRSNITKLVIYVSLNAGSEPVNLNQTRIILTVKDQMAVLSYGGPDVFNSSTSGASNIFTLGIWNQLSNTTFGVVVLLDTDKSMTSNENSPSLTTGDLAALLVNTGKVFSKYNGIPPSVRVIGKIIPPHGAATVIDFLTPPTYSSTAIELQ